MRSHKRRLVFVLTISIFAINAVASFWGIESFSATQQKNANKSHYPVADYLASEPADAEKRALREVRGSRYSRGRNQVIKETSLEELPLNSHWWLGLSALPADQSDAVLIGVVAEAEAFLSNDKTAVYSEFTVGIYEVLKSRTPLAPGDRIVAERPGGAVRFKSGRLQYYSLDKQGLPQTGNRYLFFLRRNDAGNDFSILVAYELRAGRVYPLDGEDSHQKSKLPFDEYRGYGEERFLGIVREAVGRSVSARK